ncbi:MAG: hypothetical protein WC551_01790 [Patescibacteria group bacterium]
MKYDPDSDFTLFGKSNVNHLLVRAEMTKCFLDLIDKYGIGRGLLSEVSDSESTWLTAVFPEEKTGVDRQSDEMPVYFLEWEIGHKYGDKFPLLCALKIHRGVIGKECVLSEYYEKYLPKEFHFYQLLCRATREKVEASLREVLSLEIRYGSFGLDYEEEPLLSGVMLAFWHKYNELEPGIPFKGDGSWEGVDWREPVEMVIARLAENAGLKKAT